MTNFWPSCLSNSRDLGATLTRSFLDPQKSRSTAACTQDLATPIIDARLFISPQVCASRWLLVHSLRSREHAGLVGTACLLVEACYASHLADGLAINSSA